MDRNTAEKLRQEHPNYVPLDVAAQFFGVSALRFSWLVAEGREPFTSVGANIGTKQRYVQIYAEPLIKLLCSEDDGMI